MITLKGDCSAAPQLTHSSVHLFHCFLHFFFQDLTMHINASSEQHTQSIGKLLKNISTKPECVKEFGHWGLKISSEILLVRRSSSRFLPLNNMN